MRARIRAEYRKRFVGGGCDRRRGRERVQEAEEAVEEEKEVEEVEEEERTSFASPAHP